jgi:uncharacterized metal-binding protein YceD (DUF177 family)
MNNYFCSIELNNSIINKCFHVEINDDIFLKYKGDIVDGDIKAEVICHNIVNESFHFNIKACGKVFTSCDICLDNVELRIDFQNSLIVTLGDEDFDNGDVVFVDRNNPIINLTDIVYQLVVVALPIRRVHEPGMCNRLMMNEFYKHQVARSDDSNNIDMPHETSNGNISDKYDPRWNELKNIFNK